MPSLLTDESQPHESPVVAAHDVSNDARQSFAANKTLIVPHSTLQHSSARGTLCAACDFPLRVWLARIVMVGVAGRSKGCITCRKRKKGVSARSHILE
jgi:hypothetical protein